MNQRQKMTGLRPEGKPTAARRPGRAWNRLRRVPAACWALAAGGAVLAAALVLFFAPDLPPRPNIILFSIDTLRADRLGCYGCPAGTSPHIDAFSRDSVQFMQAISQAPSTTSSHMSLFTGLLPPVHRVTNWVLLPNAPRQFGLSALLDPAIPTLAQYLKENGYRTIGWHNGGHVAAEFGFDRGFDAYSGKVIPWGKLDDFSSFARFRSELRSGRDQKKPLFLFLHHYNCHDPYLHAPRGIRRKFLPHPEPGLPVEAGDFPQAKNYMTNRDSFWKMIDGENPGHRDHVRGLYDGGVNYSDLIFGKIVELLKSEGQYERTLIVLLSDHGEEFWEHGGTTHKNLFVETLHVPLLVKFPGGEFGGRKIEAMVGQFDIMPTLLEFVGIDPRLELQASSLLPLIHDGNVPRGRVLSFDDGLNFVRFNEGPFVYSNQKNAAKHGERLYNRFFDPKEKRNLIAKDPIWQARMRSLAAGIMKDQIAFRARIHAGPSASPRISEELQKQLKALGYL